MSLHLFILCPPFSGSTVLWKLISTSAQVSALPNEGQFLPEVADQMRNDPWNPTKRFDWERIKQVWDAYWDHRKAVLLEKSPPNLLRSREIARFFQPLRFVIMVRNPYAHCEGLMRRLGWDPATAARFAMNCLELQQDNAARYGESSLSFTYEALVADPKAMAQAIQRFVPELGPLRHDSEFEVHFMGGVETRPIVDLNQKKLVRLSRRELGLINGVFSQHAPTMQYWGYEYHTPSLRRDVAWAAARLKSKIPRTN